MSLKEWSEKRIEAYWRGDLWEFSVIDGKAVPAEYLTLSLDYDKINAALEAGVREIPGLVIFPMGKKGQPQPFLINHCLDLKP